MHIRYKYCIFAQMEKIKKVLMLLSNYDPDTHRGIARAARAFGWHLNVSMLNSFQIPVRWHGDGIICSLDTNPKLTKFILKSGLPCVDLSEWRTDLPIPRVSADNKRIGQLAAEHFCSFGHRSFGWFCHQQNPIAETRFQSYKSELQTRGIAAPSRLVGTRTQSLPEIHQWLSSLKIPAALFAYNDSDAAWLLTNCIEAGYRVPEDFAILGVDNNTLICEHQPAPLSSINHDHERIGFEGAQLLEKIMCGQPPEHEVITIEPTGVTLRASSDIFAVSDPLIHKAVSYLLKHLREPIGTTEVATELGVSQRSLELRFRAALNCSIHKKLTELRLKRAATLLTETNETIEQIAALTGFCHAPHLCRVFKKQHDLSPLAYRKTHRPTE